MSFIRFFRREQDGSDYSSRSYRSTRSSSRNIEPEEDTKPKEEVMEATEEQQEDYQAPVEVCRMNPY